VASGAVPAYPVASNLTGAPQIQVRETNQGDVAELREEIRRLIVEELHQIIKG
jgi:hypothetical protein